MLRSRATAALPAVAVALAVALLASLLVTTQNYLTLADAGQPMPWWRLLRLELRVWLLWAALSPAVAWLGRRFPLAGPRWLRHAAVHAVAGPAVVLLHMVLLVVTYEVAGPRDAQWPGFVAAVVSTLSRVFGMGLVIYAALVAAFHALAWSRDLRERAVRESRLEARLAEARLAHLSAQLHPHFLFNSLHAISALMARDVPAARQMMAQLSELLRHALAGGGEHEIPLDEELDLLGRYVELQRLRFGDRLVVRLDVEPAARPVPVPRLLLQPLFENAIRHGIERRAGGGTVALTARRVVGAAEGGGGERLVLTVCDDGPGLPPPERLREGVGLGNTRQRLAQLYGAGHRFAVGEAPGGGTRIVLEIPVGGR
ncbi:MAG TPA: histidine kinase [Thermoanaerobaculia bacterium]|nr:histidine kinase [Thermoanaerobaculia bacterium]